MFSTRFRTTTPAPAALAPTSPHHLHLPGFRGIRRSTLAYLTVALSMGLPIVNDLPAVAAMMPDPAEAPVEGQSLELTAATLEASEELAPITIERDDFGITEFTPVQWPLNPDTRISSYFGARAAACAGCSTNHHGIDWTPAYGTAVHAIADGTVISLPLSSLGEYVVIQHDIDGEIVNSVYAHLIWGSGAGIGTKVKRGQVIGKTGNTGITSGAHLHFGILHGFDAIDPLPWMKKHVTQSWGD